MASVASPVLARPDSRELENSTVCILVEQALNVTLADELRTYRSDLETEGYYVKQIARDWVDHMEVREFLIEEWTENDLGGCIIIGDLPVAWYEMFQEYDLPDNYSMFPIDHYYTDLDGDWLDAYRVNGVYDGHTSGNGDLQPEIWLGRITANSECHDEVELYKNYFRKNHDYRTGNLHLDHRSLTYIDDDWANQSFYYGLDIAPLYTDHTVVNDTTITTADDYLDRLDEGYETVEIICHANFSSTRHSFLVKDGIDNDGNGFIDEKGEGGIVTSEDIMEADPHAMFYNVMTCSAGNFTVPDYLCGAYIFTPTYGLCAIGSTKPGAMQGGFAYYGQLAMGESVGEAFKFWFEQTAEYYWGPAYKYESRSWFYGVTIFGDPTLKPLYMEQETGRTDYLLVTGIVIVACVAIAALYIKRRRKVR